MEESHDLRVPQNKRGERVAWLEYQRPPLNAIDWKMLGEIGTALDALLRDSGVRVIVFASALEKYFSTGADLRVLEAMGQDDMRRWIQTCHSLVRQIRQAQKPLLAAIHGTAVGGGLEIVLHCDVRFSASARLGQPEINIGFIPPVVHQPHGQGLLRRDERPFIKEP